MNGLKTELEAMKTNLQQNLQADLVASEPLPADSKNEEIKNNDRPAKISSSSSLKSSDLENEIEFGLKLEDACMCDDQKIGNIAFMMASSYRSHINYEFKNTF